MTGDAECQRSYIGVVIPNPMLQTVLAAESDRLTWFSGIRTLCRLAENLNTAITTVAVSAGSRFDITNAKSRNTEQSAHSNPKLCRIFSWPLLEFFSGVSRRRGEATLLGSQRNRNVCSVRIVKITQFSPTRLC